MVIFFSLKANAQKSNAIKVDSTFHLDYENMRCGVIHMNEKGAFDCDFNGHYYPIWINDTAKYKWFVRIKDGDSIFYYRKDVVRLYIWNGRPHNQIYGYVLDLGMGGSETRPDKYNGHDTLRIKEQVWSANK